MTQADRQAFDSQILATGALYGRALEKQVIDLYWSVLPPDMTIAEFIQAIGRHIQDHERGKFFPLVADLVHQAQKAKPAQWRQAWEEVISAMEDHGAYSSVLFVNQTTAAVVRAMGGWIVLCRLDLAEPWTERKFESLYKEFTESGAKDTRHFPGLIEVENKHRGHPVPPPDVIGDRRLLPEPETLAPESQAMVKILTEKLGTRI